MCVCAKCINVHFYYYKSHKNQLTKQKVYFILNSVLIIFQLQKNKFILIKHKDIRQT